MAVVLPLTRSVEPDARAKLTVVGPHGHRAGRAAFYALYREELAAGQPERLPPLAVSELQRQDAHHQQIGAVDALVALGQHRAHAEQRRPLRRPVA